MLPSSIKAQGCPPDPQEITGPRSALWEETIVIEADQNDNVAGDISLEYSADEGATWNDLGRFSGSYDFTFPSLPPGGPYTATFRFRTKAELPGCDPEYSNELVVEVSDRRGNRAEYAIPVTLTPSGWGI